jgi:regulator of sigma E protease
VPLLLAFVSWDELGKIVTFVVMLSVLVILHELGHFVVARRNGVKINEFALGMGPKLAGWVSPRTGTLYSIRALLIGGFCAMEGEDNKSTEAAQQREFRETAAGPRPAGGNFQAKGPWRRLAIVAAGPVANFLLCYLILLIGALTFGVESADKNQPVIGLLTPHSPAAIAGMKPGDRVLDVDGVAIASGKQLIDTIHASLGKRLDIVYERDGERFEAYVTPTSCTGLGVPAAPSERHLGCIGFQPVPAYVRVGVAQAFGQSAQEFAMIADQTVGSLVLLVTHFTKYAPQISGPIGIGQAATTIQSFGWGPYLWLAAMISFALGLFNLLPIPALDGGRIAFIVAEIIRGKPVDPEKEALVHIAGFAALMALMLLVAFHDLQRIFSGKGIL